MFAFPLWGKGFFQDPSGVQPVIWVLEMVISRTGEVPHVAILKSPDYMPMPPLHTAGYATTPDGIKLRYGVWLSSSEQNKGTILFLQGRREYIEKGYETIREFQSRGFGVLSFDWRGQGGSDRLLEDPRKGYVDEFSEYVTDLETIIQDVALPDCRAPFYIVAHSTGALVALLAAPRIPNKIKRMVLCSAFVGMGEQKLSQSAIKTLTGGMSALGLGDFYMSGNSDVIDKILDTSNSLTSDPVRFERTKQFMADYPELGLGGPTANWVFAACKAMEQVFDPEFSSKVTIPSLFLIAGNDRIVNNGAIEMIAARLRSARSLTVNGAQHEMFQEADKYREQCMAAILAFIPGSSSD